MPARNVFVPGESFLARPALRNEDWVYDDGARYAHENAARGYAHDSAPRGKRGAMSQEDRAVRARLRDQRALHPPALNGPFAIQRRCSFVERRPPHLGCADVDSWEQSCIEPGMFASVGSVLESAEYTMPSRNRNRQGRQHYYQDPAPQQQQMSLSTELAPYPEPRPVREMACQTNRDSILRHHRENTCDSPLSSEGEENSRVPFRVLQDENRSSNRSALKGKKKASTGNDDMSMLNMSMLDLNRSALKDIKYKTKRSFHISVMSEEVLEKAVSGLAGNGKTPLVEALSCAVHDEFEDLDNTWGTGMQASPGGVQSAEDKLATCLKKIAKRAEKACTLNSLASAKEERDFLDDPAGAWEQCSLIEDKIAQSDLRMARLREELRNVGQSSHACQADNYLASLSAQLMNAAHSPAVDENAAAPEITSSVDKSIQGLVAVETCCRQMLRQSEEEQQCLQDQNKGFCPAAAALFEDDRGVGNDEGARGILRSLR